MNSNIKKLTLGAVLLALTFVITRFIQIPIPLGYFNIGNSVILLGCLLVPMGYGVIAGGVGSALADLTSYPVYTLPTLIIKSIMPAIFYLMLKLPIKKDFVKSVLAFAVATLLPLFGYTLTGCILYGFVAGLAQFPGLLLEYVANIVVFSAFYKPFKEIAKRI
ncbi:MAG: ECF transporter S component [Lachnospiraceae bacterium]|nr:ECF transporter S component [Lachnospiraceae bacterium]